MDREKILSCLIATALVATVSACSRDHQPIVVGSKNFTEQVLLGEIVAQHLEHRLNEKVVRKPNLGGTLLAHQALVNGEIDLYPEYSGTALTAVLKLAPFSDPSAVLRKVKAEYKTRFGIQWLEPLGFNNTFVMVIRQEDANSQITTLSEAARRSKGWKLGVGYEFQQRPDGLNGLRKNYRLPLKGSPRTMDLGLLYNALEHKEVDMIAANATDGLLSAKDVRVLRDDKRSFPPYQAALVVRATVLENHPRLRPALEELSGKFPDETMRKLNYQVDGLHRPARDVAVEFLRQNKLLP